MTRDVYGQLATTEAEIDNWSENSKQFLKILDVPVQKYYQCL